MTGAGTRCERCGTMVPAGRVICPRCDNVVDLSFLGEATRGALDDDANEAFDEDDSPFDVPTLTTKRPPKATTMSDPAPEPEPESPTLRTIAMPIPPQAKPKVAPPKKKPEPTPPTASFAAPATTQRADAVEVELPTGPDLDLDLEFSDPTARSAKKLMAQTKPSQLLHDAPSDGVDITATVTPPKPASQPTTLPPELQPSFLNEHTQADLSDLDSLLKSSTDALILGDADDVVESLWVEESLTRPEVEALPKAKSTPDFLSAPTIDGTRDVIPVQVYIGADIARVIERDAILEQVGDHKGLLLSSFEEYVLGQIDGVRPVARIQKRMGLTDGDLRIALALLVDKKLVQRKGRAAPAGKETAPPAIAPDPSDDFVTVPRPAKASTTTELPQVPRPPPRFVATPDPAPAELPSAPTPPAPIAPAMAPMAAALPRFDERGAPSSTSLPGTPKTSLPESSLPGTLPASPSTQKASTTSQKVAAVPSQMPPTMDYANALRTGLVVDDAGRSKAAALHAQCLRDLKNGAVARAYAVARMAHDAAPDVVLYKEIVDDWNNFVSVHKTADDARLHAQAVNAEAAGDAARAVTLLKQAAQANPNNAAVWNRLGLLLATRMKDIDGALDAMTKAIELSPGDPTFKNNFGKIAAMADRRGAPATSKGGLFQKLFGR